MIRSEDAKEIPEFLLTETSSFERLSVPAQYHHLLINLSYPSKIFFEGDKTVMVAGLYRKSFLSVPHFWALISPELRNAKLSTFKALKDYGALWLKGSETYVNSEDERAVRLAAFFEFQPTGKQFLFAEHIYDVYRRS